MILKILASSIRQGWQLVYNELEEGYHLNTFGIPSQLIDKLAGGNKIVLSLKDGKKRRLVKGRLSSTDEDIPHYVLGGMVDYARVVRFYFYPNNTDKFQQLINRQ